MRYETKKSSIWASLASDQKLPWLKQIGVHRGASKLFILPQYFHEALTTNTTLRVKMRNHRQPMPFNADGVTLTLQKILNTM